ncbi:Copper chaperone for superoxide dismutase [Rhynchospora pubera]|uniref:Superoxide dismutase copper chaperone n=1 Tax=Rhynchospora pubera TaxID=906938 RepID=A0AAV8BUG2_9POAL|nr:Copper chaperone for superoxide dismutase [Rhynchospora pubera]
MVAFARALTAVTAVPAALAAISLSSSYSSSSSQSQSQFPSRVKFPLVSSLKSDLRRSNFGSPPAAVQMDSPATESIPSDKDGDLPELTTEFMVDMHCDGCVSAVKKKLDALEGIKSVDVDLSNQVVRVLGSLPVKTMLDALEQTGRNARLIGQGNPSEFFISAAVAEFKGPSIFGVVRFAQVNMELARIEANFSGLSPGKHAWSINEFGDLTRGAASTGKVFSPPDYLSEKPLGDLGTLDVLENGEAQFSVAKEKLKVAELIGRSVVVYGTEDKSDPGIAAAVVARSAGVGENYKKLCTCDGVTIWESS